jgi:hypothetical protein
MNLDGLLRRGALPWSPNPDASGLRVWHAYDHPLVGTFTVGSEDVLFMLVADFDGRLSVWAYTPMTTGEAEDCRAREFRSVSDLRDFLEGFFRGRPMAFAMAADLLITQWSVTRDENKAGVYDCAGVFIADIVRANGGVPDPDDALGDQLARVAELAGT